MDIRLRQCLDINPNDNLISDDPAAVFELAVPTDLKIISIDSGFAKEADSGDRAGVAGIGPVRRSPLADVMHIQIDRTGDAANRQYAGNFEVAGADALAAIALEGDGRVLGGVNEIGTAQMIIA